MTAGDAQMHWMSAAIPNDQFLLFCFAGVTDSPDDIAGAIRRRAEAIGDLGLRIREVPATLDYPYWEPTPVSASQVRTYPVSSWVGLLDVLAELMSDHLDPCAHAWRAHLLGPVVDAPGAQGASALIAVLQVTHALADGTRASSIARALFDSTSLPPQRFSPTPAHRLWPVTAALRGAIGTPAQIGRLVYRGVRAHRAYADFERAVAVGEIVRPPNGAPRTAVNVAPGERRVLGVVLTDADRLRAAGGTVTVGALVIIGEALAGHLSPAKGGQLRAEVTMAKPGRARSRNHFRNAGVDLHVGEQDRKRRAEYIRGDLDRIRTRVAHPLTAAESAAMAEVPAIGVLWGARSFDTSIVPDLVTGNTVVSSVNRGAADLVLGGGGVRFTAGFPALSPVQSLTHGVHGIGDAVAISVTAAPDVISDIDAYLARIRAALSHSDR